MLQPHPHLQWRYEAIETDIRYIKNKEKKKILPDVKVRDEEGILHAVEVDRSKKMKIHDEKLNKYEEFTKIYKQKCGENSFTWKYTAPHLTSIWHYYITKKGWNPNKAITRSDFEPIGTVQHDGSAASNHLTHKINVPTDRSGYDVILAVWDVADTANAFYNVIDVNLINDVKLDIEAPSSPNGIQTQKVKANSIELAWDASTDNVGVKGYQIFRNGVMIDTVPGTHLIDKKLQPSTEYFYTVKAIDVAGNESVQSNIFTITTKNESASYEDWDAKKAYEKGDRVLHEGKVYEAVQSYQGNGDPNWIYALSLWKTV